MRTASKISSEYCRWILSVVAGLLVLWTVQARADLLSAGVDLGTVGPSQWQLFSLNGDNSDADDFSGRASVFGSVGVAGFGKISFSGHSLVDGDIYYHRPGQLAITGRAKVTGAVHHDSASDARLDQAAKDAARAANQADSLPASSGFPTTINTNKSLTLNGSGRTVLKLTDFVLSGGARLTLHGTATTSFIINVARNFSLSSGNVVLIGGLQNTNVLFNVRGTGLVSLTGNAMLNALLLAPNRTVSMSGNSTVTGEVIANKVSLSGNATIKRPSPASP